MNKNKTTAMIIRRRSLMSCNKCRFLNVRKLSIPILLLLACTTFFIHKNGLRSITSFKKGVRKSSLLLKAQATVFTEVKQTSLDLSRKDVELFDVSDEPQFQRISSYDAWVFSAFFDNINNENLVRVFGMQDVALQEPVYCEVTDRNNVQTITGRRTLLFDLHGRRCRAVSYECILSNNTRPDTVSLLFSNTSQPSNILTVQYKEEQERSFTVCYASLFSFSNHKQLIQSIEFNRVLGAEHFFVYNQSVSKSTSAVMKHYQERGLMTIIQWSPPTNDIHYHGQILAINDCVYRNRGVSKYVVIQDTDEIIIPNDVDNWVDLISKVNKDFDLTKKATGKNHSFIGTYIVESTFFIARPNNSEWTLTKHKHSISNEDDDLFKNYSLTAFTHLLRYNATYGRARTKAFVRPELVLFPDVHFTNTHRPNALEVRVSPELALMHHMRYINTSSVILEPRSLHFRNKVLPLLKQTFLTLCKHSLDIKC